MNRLAAGVAAPRTGHERFEQKRGLIHAGQRNANINQASPGARRPRSTGKLLIQASERPYASRFVGRTFEQNRNSFRRRIWRWRLVSLSVATHRQPQTVSKCGDSRSNGSISGSLSDYARNLIDFERGDGKAFEVGEAE
ncbi:MAG: hypothetical protein U1F42_01115 [Candidatus Competibacteraceae bacterium]